jgi:predicted DsbA family dithiol-disulfide isomerase
MADTPNPRLTIDVISDVVCPWCYIGKRRLEAALAELAMSEPDLRAFVSWHPFELNPDMPREGIERREYVRRKFGDGEQARGVYDRVRAIGTQVGLPFAFDSIARQPNTREAHRLIAWGQGQGDADKLVERLFRAFFVEGRDIGDVDALATIASQAGYDGAAARAYLAGNEGRELVEATSQRVRDLGVNGVPFFIFDNKVAVSGAQEPGTLLEAIAEARERESSPG